MRSGDEIEQERHPEMGPGQDNFTRIVNLFEDGDWVILEWTGGGTFYKTKRSKGKKFMAEGCGFFKFRAGRIIFQRGFWDKAKWDAQING
jgi:hypothetical protein